MVDGGWSANGGGEAAKGAGEGGPVEVGRATGAGAFLSSAAISQSVTGTAAIGGGSSARAKSSTASGIAAAAWPTVGEIEANPAVDS